MTLFSLLDITQSIRISEKLTPYGYSCDCSDALLKLNYRNGGFLSGPTMYSPKRQEGSTKIIGPAYTVKYAPLSDPAPKVANHYVSIKIYRLASNQDRMGAELTVVLSDM